jgi:redox-sensitive bicupin YhaK (pirin superfamily)
MTRVSRRHLVGAAGFSTLSLGALAVGAGVPILGCASERREADGTVGSLVTVGGPVQERTVRTRVDAQPTTDGAGVRLSRVIGGAALGMLDPFLLLDEFHTEKADDYIAGFPSHPHRGFETVTYMIDGAMEHRDSLGNHGHLGPGSAQWMTAGHGIVHSEMPQQESGRMWGFQLWVNLPAAQKMVAPRYQDIRPGLIAETEVDDAHVRLVAGQIGGASGRDVTGPVSGIVTAPTLADVTLRASGTVRHTLPAGHSAFVYVIEGSTRIAGTEVKRGQLAVLTPGERVTIKSDSGGRALLVAAAPIGEPVSRYGPFVMNTDEEIRQAMADYRSGRLTQI